MESHEKYGIERSNSIVQDTLGVKMVLEGVTQEGWTIGIIEIKMKI